MYRPYPVTPRYEATPPDHIPVKNPAVALVLVIVAVHKYHPLPTGVIEQTFPPVWNIVPVDKSKTEYPSPFIVSISCLRSAAFANILKEYTWPAETVGS